MARKVTEWRGKNDDAKAPPRVRQRRFDTHGGICHICKLPIKVGETWHLDHIKALIEGGENRETNLAPAHGHCNLAKGVEESKRKSKTNDIRQKHIGAVKPKGSIPNRGFQKPNKPRKEIPPRPPRPLYEERT